MASARRLLAVAAAVALLSGCGALGSDVGEVTVSTATREPEYTPPPLDPSDFDLVVTREFTVDSVTVTCRAYLRAEGDEAASAYLAAYDASGIEPSLDQYTPEDLEARRAQGVTDHQLLFMLVTDRITEDFKAAGLLTTSVSMEGETRCE
ncbi:hypothetical protein M2152_001565 [Microbacteriaceae bacterium SG_E_30_P1]|uniref:Lipoprotein n=1 Tax=Antiquaquibacter oligotrophicus TaxID=2880260 RepID=A0ABT6KMZ4_9MICO|nr:hypothetical protein [Antiquaquibacter oligotrophicus]MDH6181383.1 hypothetical protein [Antiquaquibacter oligotrophicus]UDF12924.1 hypothetical protein LH407_12290 [Antiquaquibacter oligotrophicus]